MAELKWTRTFHSDSLVIYRSGKYTIEGYSNAGPGEKLVRRWRLYYADNLIDSPARLSEAKRDAQYHADQHAEDDDLIVYAVVVKSQLELLDYRSFHRTEDGAQKSAEAYNTKYSAGPRATVKAVTVAS